MLCNFPSGAAANANALTLENVHVLLLRGRVVSRASLCPIGGVLALLLGILVRITEQRELQSVSDFGCQLFWPRLHYFGCSFGTVEKRLHPATVRNVDTI